MSPLRKPRLQISSAKKGFAIGGTMIVGLGPRTLILHPSSVSACGVYRPPMSLLRIPEWYLIEWVYDAQLPQQLKTIPERLAIKYSPYDLGPGLMIR